MKRLFTAFLAMTMIVFLAGCASAGQPESSPPSASAQVGTDAPEDNTQPFPELTLAVPNESEPADNEGQGQPSATPTSTPQGNSPAPSTQSAQGEQPVQETQAIAAPVPAPTPQPVAEPATSAAPKILIAYFTWADNTVVEDPGAVDVDASTSASVLAPGNAAKMVSWIRQEVGGDLHSITVAEPYSSDYDECLDRAADEKARNARPVLTSHVNNFDDYDIIFLGFPNWWYTLPMPVLSFVDAYDWSGKTVVPFVTHGTGGLASTIRDLDAALPGDVTRLDPIGVYRPEVDNSQCTVRQWAASLDLGV